MSSGAERSSDDGTGNYGYLKILIPAFAVGGIIGPKGKTIASIQVENRVKIQISKMNDYYPGTTERICLVSGPKENIMEVLKFCIKVINEKPHLDYAPLIDFDHKVTFPRRQQIKILIPNKTASRIIGNRGKTIREIKMKSGAFVQISQITDDVVIYERCITVMGEMQNNLSACDLILDLIIGDKHMESCLHISYSNSNHCAPNSNPIGSPIAEDWKTQTCPKILEAQTELNFTIPSAKVSLGTLAKNIIQASSLNKPEPTSSQVKSSSLRLGKSDRTLPLNTSHVPSSNAPFFNSMGSASSNLPNINFPLPGAQPAASVPQFLDNLKVILRNSFYPPEILAKINHALTTLANHGVLELFIRLLIDYNRNLASVYRNLDFERPFIDSPSLYQPPAVSSENMFVPNQEFFPSAQRMNDPNQSMFGSVWHPTDFEADPAFYPTATTPTWANQDPFSDKSDVVKPFARHMSNSDEPSRSMTFDEFPPLSSGVFTPGSKML